MNNYRATMGLLLKLVAASVLMPPVLLFGATKQWLHLCYVSDKDQKSFTLEELAEQSIIYCSESEEEFGVFKKAWEKTCTKTLSAKRLRSSEQSGETIRQFLGDKDSSLFFWAGDSIYSSDMAQAVRTQRKKEEYVFGFVTIPDSLIAKMNDCDSRLSGVVYDVGVIRASVYKMKQSVLTAIKIPAVPGRVFIGVYSGVRVAKEGETKSEIFDGISLLECGEINSLYKAEIEKLNPDMPEKPEEGYKVRFPTRQ